MYAFDVFDVSPEFLFFLLIHLVILVRVPKNFYWAMFAILLSEHQNSRFWLVEMHQKYLSMKSRIFFLQNAHFLHVFSQNLHLGIN